MAIYYLFIHLTNSLSFLFNQLDFYSFLTDYKFCYQICSSLPYVLFSYFSLYRFFHSVASSLGCSDSINAPPIKSASTLHSFKNAICSFVVTPLSETNTVPSGTIGRSLFVFSREMVKSFKLRLFTPMIFGWIFNARPISSSSCVLLIRPSPAPLPAYNILPSAHR